MNSVDPFIKKIGIFKTSIEDISHMIEEHMGTLTFPLDSWLEDNLMESTKYKFITDRTCIGYAGVIGDILHSFYVKKKYFNYAPALLERIVEEKQIKRVSVFTQDSLLTALIAEWDYNKEKRACFFYRRQNNSDY